MQNKQNRGIPINPLSLGIAYFGFSILLLGLHINRTATVLGWVAFGVSALLFIAVFEKHVRQLVDKIGHDTLVYCAGILALLDLIVGALNFLSGKGGWEVTLILTFLLLWIVAIAGAWVGATRIKNWGYFVSLVVVLLAITKFAYSNYVQGGFLLGFSIFLFLIGKGIIKNLPEPPDS